MSCTEKVLILTPVKDGAHHLESYWRGLDSMTYPRSLLSLGLLESDSHDGTYNVLSQHLEARAGQMCRMGLWKRDYGFTIPPGIPRHAPQFQIQRRTFLAKSRNQLLFRALQDEDWVLWLDVDVVEYPPNIIETLLATGKQIVQPNCVCEYGGPTFDLNAWRDQGRLHMHDLRAEGDLVPLDSVGGTMLLVAADSHRDGLVFPPFPYGKSNSRIRLDNYWLGEIETEGFGMMAGDLGVQCWGMPGLEIKHYPG
jgi:hypothetical protein